MRQQQAELDRLGIRVAVVSFDSPAMAQGYQQETAVPWPLLLDPGRTLYRAYGMEAASALDVWGPSTWLAYARQLLSGQRLAEGGADAYQRGGDVLVDPAGVVRLHHVGAGPADRPSVESLLACVTRG